MGKMTSKQTWIALLCAAMVISQPAFAQNFTHPGCLSTTNDFARMAAKVQAGAHPWIDSWNTLTNNSHAQTSYTPSPVPILQRGNGGGACLVNDTYPNAMNDAAAAYQLSLRWQITGNNAYANAATNILNQWATVCTNLCGDPNIALLSLYGYQFACAAENLRTYTNWSAADFGKFQAWMTNNWYPLANSFISGHFGQCATYQWANWDLCSMDTILAIGVLCDRPDIYNEAINYYTNGAGAGASGQVMTFSFPGYLGECQESGRDQGHCTLDPILLSVFCEIAWNQGADMYGYNTNGLLQISEYVSKYNAQPLNNTVPYVCYMNCAYYTWNIETINPTISSSSRGNARPGMAMIYNHYVNRRGLSAPWTGLMATQFGPDGGGGNYGGNSGGFDQLGFTMLTHTLDPIASAPAPSSVIAPVRNNAVTLSWFGSAGATSYNVKRATVLAGTYTNIASVPGATFCFTNVGLTQGTNYYYAVSAIVNGVETTNSTPVSVTPNLQLSGTIIGSPDSYSSAGADITCLFDGSLQNFYDAYDVSGDWGGLDLGRSNVITQVAYCPRAAFSGRMVGGQFQGANVPDFSSGVVTLFTISSGPADTSPPTLTYQTVSNTNAFRYVRYLGPANGSCNAAEIQFFGATAVPTVPNAPSVSATAGNGQAALGWSVPDTTMSFNLKRGTNSGGPYLTIVSNLTTTTYLDTGLTNCTNYYYVVSAVNAAGESSNSTEVFVAPTPNSQFGSVVWSGVTNGVWDISTPNWWTNLVAATYQNGNSVLFDDSAGVNTTISIPSSVLPASVTFNNSSKYYYLSGSSINSSSPLIKLGTGTAFLASANSFPSATLNAGTVTIQSPSSLGSGTLTLSGGTLSTYGLMTYANNIVVSGSGSGIALASANNLTLTGTLSGSGNLTIAPAGGPLDSLYLNFSQNSASGTITIPNSSGVNQTVTRFSAATAGSATAAWSIGGAQDRGTTFDFGAGTISFGSLSGSGLIQGNSSGVHTILAGALNTSTTFSGVISDTAGTVALTKIGAGTLTLSGACNYSGPTTVTNGELIVSTVLAGKSSCWVTNGAAFGVMNLSSGSGTISNLTLAAGTTLEMINVTNNSTPLLVCSNVSVGGSCPVKITEPNGIIAGYYPLVSYSGKFQGVFTNLQVQLPASVTNVLSGTLVSNANQIVLSVIATTPPPAPATLTASAGNAQVALTWSASIGASGYNVWRSITSGSGYSFIAATGSGASYTDTTAANNQPYYYVVSATNVFGSSGYSPEAGAIPRLTVNWSGATNANWDTTTTNWLSTGLPATYKDGAIARFDDTALSNFTITVSSVMSPSMVVVSNNTDNYSFSGSAIAGTNSLTKLGSATLTLSNTNTFSGGLTINAGLLYVPDNVSPGTLVPFGTGNVTVNGGQIQLGTAVGANNFGEYDYTNVIILNGGIIYENDAFQHLKGALTVGPNGGTLGATYDNSTDALLNGFAKGLFIDGVLSGTGNLTVQDSSIDTSHSWDSSTVYFTSSSNALQNTYSGTITVNPWTSQGGSYLYLVGTNALANATINVNGNNGSGRFGTPALLFGSGTNLDGAGYATIGGLAGSGNFVLANTKVVQGGYSTGAAFALTVGNNNSNSTYSGVMSGAGSLTKTGTGTLTLTGTNTYTGQTTVSNGELVVSTVFAGNGKFMMTNGATLGVTNLSNGSALVSNLVAAAGTALEFFNVSSTATPLVLASNLTLGGSCTLKITGTNGLVAGSTYPLIKYAGTLSGAFSSFQLQMPYGWRGTLTTASRQISLANVAVVATTPPPMSVTLNGQQLQLLWPQTNTGWRLLMNTNLAGTNWLDVSGANATNLMLFGSTNRSLFFRLIYP